MCFTKSAACSFLAAYHTCRIISIRPTFHHRVSQVLSQQPDRSVTVSSIGFLTNLHDLLASGPDGHSALDGVALVRQKVRRLVWMGGRYPSSGQSFEWNFGGGGAGFNHSLVASEATNYTLSHLPLEVEVIFAGAEVGSRIKSGGNLSRCAPASNPCRAAFEAYGVGPSGHASFDPATTLMGVRGVPGSGCSTIPYTVNGTGGHNVADAATGCNAWVHGTSSNQSYVELACPKSASASAIGAAIDSLLCEQ